MENNYPLTVCSECVGSNKMPEDHLATMWEGICDVCNLWKIVTSPSDYGYPNLKVKLDKHLIIKELDKQRKEYIKMGNLSAAEEISLQIVRVKFM